MRATLVPVIVTRLRSTAVDSLRRLGRYPATSINPVSDHRAR